MYYIFLGVWNNDIYVFFVLKNLSGESSSAGVGGAPGLNGIWSNGWDPKQKLTSWYG